VILALIKEKLRETADKLNDINVSVVRF